MVTELKLFLTVNSVIKLIILFLFTLTLICCSNSQNKVSNNKATQLTDLDSVNYRVYNTDFSPDTTVNNILILNNFSSAPRFYSGMNSEKLVTNFRESPVFLFSNNNVSEYLLLYQFEGSTRNSFSCFEIGLYSKLKKNTTSLSYKRFKTESGLMLGMSIKDLEIIKGKMYSINNDKVVYKLSDYTNSEFLKRNNMPSYFLECTFENEKIVKIKYGFEYP